MSGVAAFDLCQRNRRKFISAKMKFALGDKVRKDGPPGERGVGLLIRATFSYSARVLLTLVWTLCSFEVRTVLFCFPGVL